MIEKQCSCEEWSDKLSDSFANKSPLRGMCASFECPQLVQPGRSMWYTTEIEVDVFQK